MISCILLLSCFYHTIQIHNPLLEFLNHDQGEAEEGKGKDDRQDGRNSQIHDSPSSRKRLKDQIIYPAVNHTIQDKPVPEIDLQSGSPYLFGQAAGPVVPSEKYIPV